MLIWDAVCVYVYNLGEIILGKVSQQFNVIPAPVCINVCGYLVLKVILENSWNKIFVLQVFALLCYINVRAYTQKFSLWNYAVDIGR